MMIALTGAKTVIYSAWFCPFAQRAWSALNELGVEYELVEALKIDPATESYIKDEELLKCNPKGLVPTIVQEIDDEKNVFCDSMGILRELYTSKESPCVEEAHKEAIRWNQEICSPFYGVLMKKTPEERQKAWGQMLAGLTEFSTHLEMKDDSISFYRSASASGEKPSLVDFCIFPFIHRLYIIEHYKGLTLPENSDKEKKTACLLLKWKDKMESLPSVQPTLADSKDLTAIYLRYADGSAKSKVADLVREGRQAHEA
jgi:glutathione S-transferase